ncbi:MAG: lytic transglycosylase domain-containing protein [Lachnospiraceae bacterium]|nr:lytic transglycosylase domain-containing protein [Lachnospiraceae bacterium]
MIINGLNSTKDNTYYNNISSSADHGDFDSVFDAATVIYAKPFSSEGQASSNSIKSPASMDAIFKEAADTYGISENLLKAVAKAESGFDPNSTSGAGAMGIMQLMPSTAKELGVTDAYDIKQNIMGGAKLLSSLLDKYNGNTSLALAAYNAGSGNVDKYGGIPPFKETQNYVSKIMGYLGNGDGSIPDTIYATANPSSSGGQANKNADPSLDITTIYAQAAFSTNTQKERIHI